MKGSLTKEPILSYPNSKKPYVLFTDANKYAWACVLTQTGEQEVNGKKIDILHPITYMSGLFCSSQMNCAALTKEAYAICMSFKNKPTT